MASIPPYPDPADAAAYKVSDDIQLYIRVDEAQHEQPVDYTYRPDIPEADERGVCFRPFLIGPPRKLHIIQLLLTPLLLFQVFIPLYLANLWASYTNYDLPAD